MRIPSLPMVTALLFFAAFSANAQDTVSGVRDQLKESLSRVIPGNDAPLYPGGAEVECAMAIVVLRAVEGPPADPWLRSPHGDLDCSATFAAAGFATQTYVPADDAQAVPHLYATRPLLSPSGDPYIEIRYTEGSFQFGFGSRMALQDGAWVIAETLTNWIT